MPRAQTIPASGLDRFCLFYKSNFRKRNCQDLQIAIFIGDYNEMVLEAEKQYCK